MKNKSIYVLAICGFVLVLLSYVLFIGGVVLCAINKDTSPLFMAGTLSIMLGMVFFLASIPLSVVSMVKAKNRKMSGALPKALLITIIVTYIIYIIMTIIVVVLVLCCFGYLVYALLETFKNLG